MTFRHIHDTDLQKHYQELEKHMRRVGHAAVHEEVGSAREIFSLLGDKWGMPILVMLGAGPKRFNEIRRVVNDVSQRMLTRVLRRMERDGLVEREILPTNPPGVVYALTKLGFALCVPADALAQWAFRSDAKIKDAQKAFDRSRKPGAAKRVLDGFSSTI
jgi:DNA-binding HxlR family transcriptional regulator